jgi:hypothetical protein
MARAIAKRDGITDGLVCILRAVEEVVPGLVEVRWRSPA